MSDIQPLKQEARIFPPPPPFVRHASIAWHRRFTQTLNEADAPFYK